MQENHPSTPPAGAVAPSSGPDQQAIEFAHQVFECARRGDAVMLGRLIDKGLPPNLRNDKGDSLVMLASYHGHAEAVRVLLSKQADPNLSNDNGQLPIAGAAFKGYRDVIEALLANGAEVDGASADGRTALMMAAMFNRTEIVDLLIAHGANPDATDANGVTALDAARRMGAPATEAQLAARLTGNGKDDPASGPGAAAAPKDPA
ncbi:MAG: ankyrin repeat domain-containing protein [Janthinobacterium lividum]